MRMRLVKKFSKKLKYDLKKILMIIARYNYNYNNGLPNLRPHQVFFKKEKKYPRLLKTNSRRH